MSDPGPRWTFVSTCDHTAATDGRLETLLGSAQAALPGRHGFYIVFQEVEDQVVGRLTQRFAIDSWAQTGRLSLAAARNRGLALAAPELPGLVGFPDDDAWLHPGALEAAEREFAGGADLVCGGFSPAAAEPLARAWHGRPVPLSVPLAFRYVNSNAMFATGAAIRRIGGFDERFGVGARFSCGEDVDFVVRGIKAGLTARLVPEVLMGHPDKGIQLQRYYEGSLALLAKHSYRDAGVSFMLARRLARGVKEVAAGGLSSRSLLEGMQAAATVRRSSS